MCGVRQRPSRRRASRSRRRVVRSVIAVVVLAAAALSLRIAPPKLGIEVRNEANEPVARFEGVRSFGLAHTHSVMKTPVEDYYVVEGRDRLVQTKTRYRSLGAGLPFAGVGEFRREEGWFVREDLDGTLPNITVRVGRVSDQVLTIGDQEIPLRDLDQPGKALTIRARMILFSVLWI